MTVLKKLRLSRSFFIYFFFLPGVPAQSLLLEKMSMKRSSCISVTARAAT